MPETFSTAQHKLVLFKMDTGKWFLQVQDNSGNQVEDFALEDHASGQGLGLTVVDNGGSTDYQLSPDVDISSTDTLFDFRKVNAHLLSFGVQSNAEFAGVGVADLRECGTLDRDLLVYVFWLGPPNGVASTLKEKILRVDPLSDPIDKGLKVYAKCNLDRCAPSIGPCVSVTVPSL